jgi:ubiquinone/menaquinone biosynthesis C-methylase UbiE
MFKYSPNQLGQPELKNREQHSDRQEPLTVQSRQNLISDSINRRFYESPGVVERYENHCEVMGAELAILESLQKDARNQPLLEIGIGAGRMTSHMLAITKDYVGIDYSTRMVEMCQRRFDSTFMVCDARDMSLFGDERFSTVTFWGNGIDEVNPSDRFLILNEIHRVLKKNGLFIFSSHNLEWSAIPSYVLEDFSLPREPLRDNAMRVFLYAHCGATRLWARYRRRGYAVILEYDDSEKMTVPRYFVEKETQVRQLFEAGFHQVEALASDGSPLDDRNRSTDFLVFYTARKK